MILALVLIAGAPVQAQTMCELRTSLLAKLNTGYEEKPVAVGVGATGNLVELLVSTDGTWTILVTRPNGIACIAAVGEDWQNLKVEPADESS